MVNLLFKWDFPEAEAYLRKAVTLDPNNLEARMGLGYFAMATGKNEKMIQYFEEAVKLDPLSLPAKHELARAYNIVGRSTEALALFNEVLELDPVFVMAYIGKSAVYLNEGQYDKAEEVFKEASKYSDLMSKEVVHLGYIAALKGETEKAQDIIVRLKNEQKDNPSMGVTIGFALIYAALGDKENARKCIEKAVDQRFGAVLFLHTIPAFNPLKNDPEFVQIFQELCPEHRIAKVAVV